ncbi:MAG: PQQ-dependent sugar dehydrogenase [Solirubrobacteraceae bacterium]|nr:PQQ-dependent sugar dehydrogenase [Solirubrobacteraceae bacterium]
MRRALLAALAVVLLCPAGASALPTGFREVPLATGLHNPTAVAFAPDGRMFIAEQPGRVLVRNPGGGTGGEVILDWRDQINSYGDRGLVGIATDVDFAGNGYLYIVFVADGDATDDDGPHSSRLVRLTVSPANEVVATKSLVGGNADQGTCPEDTTAGTVGDTSFDCIPAGATTHTIGTVASDPRDGTLWFGSGDGQSIEFNIGNRPKRMLTMNDDSFVGKVLHVDRDGNGLPGHAFCPAVSDLTKVCTKVHAKGFRNPFRFTIPKQDGAPPIVADVGNVSREEINIAVAGGNYGWPCWEGTDVRPNYYNGYALCSGYVNTSTTPATPRNVQLPAFAYGHPIVDGVPQGAAQSGPVYDGAAYPDAYRGALFFGDYALGFVRYFPRGATPGTFSITPQAILDFSEANSSVLFMQRGAFTQLTADPGADLVIVDFITPGPNFDYTGPGQVVRVEYADGNEAPKAVAKVAAEEIAVGGTAAFDATASSDPDGDALTYAWDFDGDGTIDSMDAAPTHVFATGGIKTVKLTVDDGHGRTASTTVTVLVGEHRPRVQITAPLAGELYDGGQSIAFSGGATDAEDGALAPAQLRWEVQLIHGSHLHPIVELPGTETGSFLAWQDHGLDSHYRLRLTATDSSGLTATATTAIQPRPAGLTVTSDPAGASIRFGGQEVGTGATITASGMRATLAAAPAFTRDGRIWRFTGWSDGVETSDRDITVPRGGVALVARYAVEPDPPASDPAPPSGGSSGPGGGTTTPPAAKPRLTLTKPWRTARTARSLTGTLTGQAARPTVQVALAKPAGTRCRWWSVSKRRYGTATSCTKPVWTTAKLTRSGGTWRFSAALGAAVPRSAARVQVRARAGGRTVASTTVRISAR